MTAFWRPLVLLACLLAAPARAEDAVKVTVLAILANATDDKVCPKCGPIAKQIQKSYPELTGFHIERTTVREVPVGKAVKFPLVESAEVAVTIEEKVVDGKISLTIEPPTLGAVTINCKCGKTFPILTRFTTVAGEQLIVAVMAEACAAKK